MIGTFINRQLELKELDQFRKKFGLVVIFGRRRIGKTHLLTHWLQKNKGLYAQAIEGSREIQISQIFQDINEKIQSPLTPKSWQELFSILEMIKEDVIFCIDEFPYLVASDPSLPSILQKWLDHKKKKNVFLILCGSSQHMMHDIFLNRGAPLYGRSQKIIHVQPMDYKYFCEARKLKILDMESFVKFSLVGGIPKYWEYIEQKDTAVACAQELYFGFAPYMESEPQKILQDEKISGLHPMSVLEAIGRGATKPSEIATRLAIPQTQISKVLYRLMDASIVARDIPFGQSERNPKMVLYKIIDPSIRFWYSVYSPHRTRWSSYGDSIKEKLLHDFASTVFEDTIRKSFPDSKRYWEKNLEFDLVREKSNQKIEISEVKFRILNEIEKNKILVSLEKRWNESKLFKKHTADFQVIDYTTLFS